jgi:hypothetical protein
LLKTLLEAGVRPDPDRAPERESGERPVFAKYPILSDLDAVVL